MNTKRYYSLILMLFFVIIVTNAQDSTRHRYFDSSLFADDDILTNSDYLVRIQKINQTLNKVPILASAFYKLNDVAARLSESDTALRVIRERLSTGDRTLNIRNLQMFHSLLETINDNDKQYMEELNKYDNKLDTLKKEILDLRKDTSIRHIYRDSVLRKIFIGQLKILRTKWKNTDSLVRFANTSIDSLKAIASANTLNVAELLYQTDFELTKIGPRAFTKERNYLWEQPRTREGVFSFKDRLKRSSENDNKTVWYYFSNTRNKRLWLLFTGLIFFYWVFYNFRSLKIRGKIIVAEKFNFKYINPLPVATCLIFVLNLAPLFDLHAPAIYIEICQFLLMLILTALFWKEWPRKMFYYWCVIVLLFLLLSFSRIAGLPYYIQRWWVLFINTGAVLFGFFFWLRLKKSPKGKIVFVAAALYVVLNFFAVVCNLFGRVTLTQIFGYTSIYAFAQIVCLTVFIQLLEEAFLLQIQASRIRKNYPEDFDAIPISKGINKLIGTLALIIWLITFAVNLNIYTFLYKQIQDLLTTPQEIGSFSFTLGGIILFLGIIWFANFLQKYIAYFFGDIGDDAAFDNKGQRSRLMITRLILLIAGFLLAVAASGLPVDKITVILGALGIGVGLGLQSIVNNFVSGIILIFDRPLRIGDTVEIGDKKGRVKEISIRSSTLLTPDGAEVIIPNGDVLSHNIVNWTLSNNHIRIEFPIVVDKFPDQEHLKNDFKTIIQSIPNALTQKEPDIVLTNISGKSVTVLFIFWCKDVTKLESTRSEVSTAVYHMLQEKGINVI
jgi:potassium-dependent mechanosensitive channel